jgi:peptide methionine sulfoxide reductase MsrA
VRVEYNPTEISYENLLDLFWDHHDPTTLNRQVFYDPSPFGIPPDEDN